MPKTVAENKKTCYNLYAQKDARALFSPGGKEAEKMLLYVVRHGDPIYSPDQLTPKGMRQAEALSRRFAYSGLDKIFVSPLNRARQTAQPTCELLKITPQVEEWTSEATAWEEFAFHDPARNGAMNWTFHIQSDRYKTSEILALGDKWYTAWPFCEVRCKEGYERIMRESDSFMAKLGYERDGLRYRVVSPNDMHVAVFCHQGFGTTWLSHLLGIPPVLFWSTFDLNHSSVTVIRFANNKDGWCAPMCIALSDTSHLFADRQPLEFCNEYKY